MANINVLIIEDNKFICEFYKALLKEITEDHPQIKFKYNVFFTIQSVLVHLKNEEVKSYHLLILDIGINERMSKTTMDGESIGLKMKIIFPNLKVIIITRNDSAFHFHSALNKLKPEGYLLKHQLCPKDFKKAILMVLDGGNIYSQKLTLYLKRIANDLINIDAIDRHLLHLLLQGVMNKDLIKYLPLSQSGVEKRKRKLARQMGLSDARTPTLIRAARDLGYS